MEPLTAAFDWEFMKLDLALQYEKGQAMWLQRSRLAVRRSVVGNVLCWLFLAANILAGFDGRAQNVGGKDVRVHDLKSTSPGQPMSAQVARTWIALHEARIQPLPDRAPLRQVLGALRDATRGKAGWAQGIEFRVVPEALLESEITLDTPVTLPFVGRPEVTVDTYLKYLLHEFVWERYVGEGSVLIDSPCDDCVGYATVRVAEAHTWLLLHEVVPLELPQRAPLVEFLSAITIATRGKGQDGRGLVIYPSPRALRAKGISLQLPVAINAGRTELGDVLRTSLKPLGLAVRVLPDGAVMLTEADLSAAQADVAFPEYRFSYSFVWNQWVEAQKRAPKERGQQKKTREFARPSALPHRAGDP